MSGDTSPFDRLRQRLPETSALATVLIVMATITPLAWLKSLTNDEIYTYEVAREVSLGAVWQALASGADNHPPLDYWLRHVSMWALGPGPLSLRLPSILAVGLASLILCRFFNRRLGPPAGLAAAVLILLAGGFDAALQTRGYALLLFFFALGVTAWDALSTDDRNPAAAVTLTVSLIGALYSHYYGVFSVLAAACAGAVVWGGRRRVPGRLLIAFTITVGAALPLLPLVKAASQYRDNFWTPVTVTSLLNFYPSLLTAITPSVIIMAVVLAAAPRTSAAETQKEAGIPYATTVFLCCHALLPLPMFIVARLFTGAFLPRYAVVAGAAIACLIVAFSWHVRVPARWRFAALCVVPLTAYLVLMPLRQAGWIMTNTYRADFTAQLEQLQAATEVPVVLGDDGLFVELSHYDYADRLRNCWFVYDTQPESRTNVDRAIAGLSQIMPLRVLPYAAMKASHPQFVFIGAWGDRVLRQAVADGAEATWVEDTGTGLGFWRVAFDASLDRASRN